MVFAFRIEREKYDRGPYRLVSDNVSKVGKKGLSLISRNQASMGRS